MGQTMETWPSLTMGHMPAAVRLNSRLHGMFTFTLSPWTRREHNRGISKRSSTENMPKVWNWGGDQDHSVKDTGIFASACGEMTRRITGGVWGPASDWPTNCPMPGLPSEGLP